MLGVDGMVIEGFAFLGLSVFELSSPKAASPYVNRAIRFSRARGLPAVVNRDLLSVAVGVQIHRDELVIVAYNHCSIGEGGMAPDHRPHTSSIGGVGWFNDLSPTLFAIPFGSHFCENHIKC